MPNALLKHPFSRLRLFFLCLVLILASCEMPLTAPTPTSAGSSAPIPPTLTATITNLQIFLPDVGKPEGLTTPSVTPGAPGKPRPTQTSNPKNFLRLAYLKNGDLWLAELPELQLIRLTSSADLVTFAWSPDSSSIATFNGRSLCLVDPEDSSANQCLGLGLSDEQATIPRGIVWSPDQQTVVLWNLANPWDAGAIGWLIVPLNAPQETKQIADPVDWGLSVESKKEPGGISGQPAFLADGTLIGTFSHRLLCGDGGCRYGLYTVDISGNSLSPYPNNPDEGWSEGPGLALAPDRESLVNYGTFFSDCESFVTFADQYTFSSGQRNAFNLESEVITALELAPDAERAVIARVSGCASPPEQSTWDRACGLSEGYDIYPLQIMDLQSGERHDILPGSYPDWASSGDWIAFRSCLAQNASGTYEPSSVGPPTIYAMDLVSGKLVEVGEGLLPAWSPK